MTKTTRREFIATASLLTLAPAYEALPMKKEKQVLAHHVFFWLKNANSKEDLAKLIAFCMKNHLLSLIFKKKVYTCTAVNERLGLERYQILNLDLFNGKILINIYFQFEIVSE